MVCSISSARTTKSRCREVSRRQTKDMLRVALLCAMALFLTGCLDRMAEEVEEPGMYMPGSRVTSTPGKRYVIRGAEVTSASVAKWRVRSESTKIYGADHVPLARLKVRETAQGSEIVATSLDGSREVIAKLSKKTPDRIPVGKLFNLERREGRWLVTDRQELILGVITDISPEKKKDIIFEVRDSYAVASRPWGSFTRSPGVGPRSTRGTSMTFRSMKNSEVLFSLVRVAASLPRGRTSQKSVSPNHGMAPERCVRSMGISWAISTMLRSPLVPWVGVSLKVSWSSLSHASGKLSLWRGFVSACSMRSITALSHRA